MNTQQVYTADEIKLDLRRCYTTDELAFMLHSTNIDEYGHLLRAYDLSEEELKQILDDM